MARRIVAGVYDGLELVVPDWPVATAVGNGWWRVEWVIEYQADDAPSLPHLPILYPEFANLSFVIALVPAGRQRLRLEVLSRYEKLDPLEIAFLSLLLQDLRDSVGPLRVDGFDNHPMLRMARREGA
jgi:hypothetical protein